MRQKHVGRFLIRGAHPDDVVGGIEVAATKIDLVIVGHDHGDGKRLVRVGGNSEVLRGGPREFLLPADGVDEFQYLLQLRRRNRPGFICCGPVYLPSTSLSDEGDQQLFHASSHSTLGNHTAQTGSPQRRFAWSPKGLRLRRRRNLATAPGLRRCCCAAFYRVSKRDQRLERHAPTAAYAFGSGCPSSHSARAISTASIPSWPHQPASLPLR